VPPANQSAVLSAGRESGAENLTAKREFPICVRLWHLADIDADDDNVCFWG